MAMLSNLKSGRTSFRRELILVFTLGIIFLALSASLTTAWMASSSARERMVEQGMQITGNLAEQSVLSLLVGSGDNARDALLATLGFADIDYVAIIDNSGKVLIDRGEPEQALSALPVAVTEPGKEAVLVNESDAVLQFMAPVYSFRNEDNEAEALFDEAPAATELLGYVHVTMSKAQLNAVQYAIFAQNIAVSMAFAAILLLLLMVVIRRITTPLQNLSTIMLRAKTEESSVRAEVTGPVEIACMGEVFNNMMDTLDERNMRLRRHKNMLESQIAVVTAEIVQARDEALKSNRLKSEFLANMSHELRTPLNAIIGYTEMSLEELAGPETVVSDLNRVLNASHHLLSLISSILDLAKIESGRAELLLEYTDLESIIRQTEDTIRPLVVKNDNQLKISVTKNVTETLRIDAKKLYQILLNLLSNASKFTHHGLIKIDAEHDSDRVVVVVSDTGIGMSEAQQRHIFEEFRQADMTTTRDYGGTGLGLTISQRLCRLMGGDIEVDSEPDKGSRFTINIPLPIKDNPASQRENDAHRPSTAPQMAEPSDIPSTLLIDADAGFVDRMEGLLRQSGYLVYTATSSEDGFIRACAVRPMLILLDPNLPNVEVGWALMDKFNGDLALSNVPVVIVSRADCRSEGLEIGAVEVLSKPLDEDKLLTIVNQIRNVHYSRARCPYSESK
ncbi:MAG: response regulator [Gammaproteobacteria bacterium]|nr:response regulator [Gammaproteobacteria bacterium]